MAKAGVTGTDELSRLGNLLNDLQSLTGTLPKENLILSRLYFDSMHQREDSVSDPEGDTFRWIVDIGSESLTESSSESGDQDTLSDAERKDISREFNLFLRNESGVFFVCGKPGSGKSTLMKFLTQEEKVKQELLTWAGKKRLCLAKFFFWNPGDSLQTSLEGLLRSILFETLRNCPGLIPEIFPEDCDTKGMLQMDRAPFRANELQAAIQRLFSTITFPDHRFCFFIDGLDEYKGDYLEHLDLARRLQAWGKCDDVKFVCSARPQIAFINTFQSPGRVLQLQELTRSDIRKFVLVQIEKQIKERCRGEPGDAYTEIVDKILDMADGVFLWARLVTRSVVTGIAHGDSTHALQERVRSTPRDLDSLFAKMLGNVEPAGQERSRKMLRLALHNPLHFPLCALDFSWLDDLDSDTFPLNAQDEPYSDEEFEERCNSVRGQLAVYTCGLLETIKRDSKVQVQFFHRTARDYIRSALQSTWRENTQKGADTPDLDLYLRILLARMKFWPAHGEETRTDCYYLLSDNPGLLQHRWLRALETYHARYNKGPILEPYICHWDRGWKLWAIHRGQIDFPGFEGFFFTTGLPTWLIDTIGFFIVSKHTSYALDRLKEELKLRKLGAHEAVRLLAASLYDLPSSPGFFDVCFRQGLASPSDLIPLGDYRNEPDGMSGTMWIAFLCVISAQITECLLERERCEKGISHYPPREVLSVLSAAIDILHSFLLHGADRSAVIIVSPMMGTTESGTHGTGSDEVPRFYVELSDFLQLIGPAVNIDHVQKLLGQGLKGKVWSRTAKLLQPIKRDKRKSDTGTSLDPVRTRYQPLDSRLLKDLEAWFVWGVASDTEDLSGDWSYDLYAMSLTGP